MQSRPPLLPEGLDFEEGAFLEVAPWYSGIGQDLFTALETQYPGLISTFRFFHRQHHQDDALWAVYDKNTVTFAVILDPDCEVIVLFDGTLGHTIEIGTWWDNPTEAAIAFIEEVFFGKAPSGKFSFD